MRRRLSRGASGPCTDKGSAGGFQADASASAFGLLLGLRDMRRAYIECDTIETVTVLLQVCSGPHFAPKGERKKEKKKKNRNKNVRYDSFPLVLYSSRVPH
jgi:hypothetical protein